MRASSLLSALYCVELLHCAAVRILLLGLFHCFTLYCCVFHCFTLPFLVSLFLARRRHAHRSAERIQSRDRNCCAGALLDLMRLHLVRVRVRVRSSFT